MILKRVPKNYNGIEPTGRLLKNLLSEVMVQIDSRANGSKIEILHFWSEIVGKEMGKRTRASSFNRGVLTVHVASSALLDFLVSYEKQRILEKMKNRFPKVNFKNIIFRIG